MSDEQPKCEHGETGPHTLGAGPDLCLLGEMCFGPKKLRDPSSVSCPHGFERSYCDACAFAEQKKTRAQIDLGRQLASRFTYTTLKKLRSQIDEWLKVVDDAGVCVALSWGGNAGWLKHDVDLLLGQLNGRTCDRPECPCRDTLSAG